MTYEKPNIVALASAVDVIQGSSKPNGDVQDSGVFITEPAYEADE